MSIFIIIIDPCGFQCYQLLLAPPSPIRSPTAQAEVEMVPQVGRAAPAVSCEFLAAVIAYRFVISVCLLLLGEIVPHKRSQSPGSWIVKSG